MVKVGDDNTILMNTASSVQSQDTMIINSEEATLVESDMGTMVINSDDDEASTMKSESIHTYIHKLYFSSNLRVAIVKANFSEKTITKITKYTTTY